MTMQIKTIVIYHRDGRRKKEINFKLNELNIITGNSSTGKSSLIDIVEYCLGKNEYEIKLVKNVAQNIAAFGVLYQLEDRQVFVAKRIPSGKSRKTLYLTEGYRIEIPFLDSIEDNSSDDELKVYLSDLIGIPENEVDPSSNLPKYSANIRHTLHYVFMDDPNNKTHLFYKQDDGMAERTIRDTLPVLIGAVQANYVALKNELRQKKSAQRALKVEIENANQMQVRGVSLVPGLLLEAQELGLLSQDADYSSNDGRDILNELVKNGVPQVSSIETDTSALSQLESKLADLREQEVIEQERLNQYEEYQKESTQYERAVSEHDHRLSMIDYFESEDSSTNYCPICGSTLESMNQDVIDIKEAHRHIQQQVRAVQLKRPFLTDAVDTSRTKVRELRHEMRQVNANIDAIFQAQRQAQRIQIPRQRIANFLGRVEMFLRLAPLPEDELVNINQALNTIEAEIERLLIEVSEAEGLEQIESVIFEISRYMTEFGNQIGDEYRGASFRFNLSKLTVIADRLGDTREYSRIGSDKNYLQIHLILYLALHRYFVTYNRPIPRFMLIDQVDRPFYPDDVNYNAIQVKNPENLMADPDRQSLIEIFNLFTDFCLKFGVQIIVLQHANFPDTNYQNAIIENWRDGNALIPSDWY